MPRTRVQQDQHNERRRLVKQEGRKAIFCMRYIHAKYPQIHEEACEFFAMVNQRYPGKRDLTKTSEFKHLKDEPRNMLEPHLEIQLLPNNTNSTPTTIETTTEEEIPPIGDMESEESRGLLRSYARIQTWRQFSMKSSCRQFQLTRPSRRQYLMTSRIPT